MNLLFRSHSFLSAVILLGLCALLCACGAQSQPITGDSDPDDIGDSDHDAGDSDRDLPDADADPDIEPDADEDDIICEEYEIPENSGTCTGDGFCWQHPAPFGAHLNGVWGSGPNDVWAVGNSGVIAHFDGSEWSFVASPTVSNLNDVWGFSNDDVWIVGENGEAYHFDGNDWDQLDPDLVAGADLFAAWGSAPDDLWFAGQGLYRYLGDDQVEPYSGGGEFARISGSGPNDVRTINSRGYLYTWDGTDWEVDENPGYWDNNITSIWMSAPDNLWVSSYTESVAHFDGESWTQAIGTGDLGEIEARTIVGTSSENVWFLGGRVVHFDGTEFAEVTGPGPEMLNDSWMDATGNQGWAVGSFGRLIRFSEGQWTVFGGAAYDPSRPLDFWLGLIDVFALDDDNAWAVGYGTILRFDGENWSEIPDAPQGTWEKVWASSPDDLWVAGEFNDLVHWDGETWTTITADTYFITPHDMWGVSADNMWFAADSSIFHWDGSTMSAVFELELDEQYILEIDGSSPNNIWAVTFEGLYRFDGTQWEQIPNTFDDPSLALRVFGPDDVWVTHGDGTVRRWDGTDWTTPPQIDFVRDDTDGTVVFNLTGLSPDDLWAITDSGDAYHFDGSCWALAASMGTNINRVSQTPSGTLFAVGEYGSILRRLPSR